MQTGHQAGQTGYQSGRTGHQSCHSSFSFLSTPDRRSTDAYAQDRYQEEEYDEGDDFEEGFQAGFEDGRYGEDDDDHDDAEDGEPADVQEGEYEEEKVTHGEEFSSSTFAVGRSREDDTDDRDDVNDDAGIQDDSLMSKLTQLHTLFPLYNQDILLTMLQQADGSLQAVLQLLQ